MALIDRLNAIGNAIREKNGTTELIPLADMPQAILDIVSGGGVQYTSIIYKEDDTITLIDTDGVTHTMSYAYENDKLKTVTHDDKKVELVYKGNVLVKVGKTTVDIANVPQTPATTINADSCVAQVILPVVLDTVTAEINSGTVQVDSSASLEE